MAQGHGENYEGDKIKFSLQELMTHYLFYFFDNSVEQGGWELITDYDVYIKHGNLVFEKKPMSHREKTRYDRWGQQMEDDFMATQKWKEDMNESI